MITFPILSHKEIVYCSGLNFALSGSVPFHSRVRETIFNDDRYKRIDAWNLLVIGSNLWYVLKWINCLSYFLRLYSVNCWDDRKFLRNYVQIYRGITAEFKFFTAESSKSSVESSGIFSKFTAEFSILDRGISECLYKGIFQGLAPTVDWSWIRFDFTESECFIK